MPKNSLLFLQICFSIFSFFSAIRKEVEERWEVAREDVGCAGATMPALEPHGVTTEEAKRLGSISVVQRHSKNDLTCHQTPHFMCPLHYGIQQPYLKWVPRLSWGLPKLRVQRQNKVVSSSCTRCPIEGHWHPQASYLSLDQEVSFMPFRVGWYQAVQVSDRIT
jgi:hypothetical protein